MENREKEDIPNVHPNKVEVADFLMSWAHILPSAYFMDGEEIHESNFLESDCFIPDEMVSELEALCGADSLKCEEDESDPKKCNLLHGIPDKTNLVTLRILKEGAEKDEIGHKMFSSVNITLPLPKKVRPEVIVDEGGNIISPLHFTPDVVLTVQVYDPFPRSSLLRMDSEVMVCGRQCLTELRDMITCPKDLVIAGEFSHNLDLPKDICAKDLYKSGYFFIEDTFYNDMRDQTNRDYSQLIMKWANERDDRGIGPFESKLMEKSTFLDLTIQLGKPYVYVHQGDCEHLLVFTTIRMLHESDSHEPSDYPLQVKSKIRRCQKCRVCSAFSGKWVIRGSHLLPADPCLLCEPCLKLLHYDGSGQKIGDFTAQVFVDHSFKHLPKKS